jgi:5'(3')-deoxyribonucleotidase
MKIISLEQFTIAIIKKPYTKETKMNKDFVIALDMDGVLVDFDKGMKTKFGIDTTHMNKSSADMTPEEKIQKKKMYSKLQYHGDTFWKHLDPMPQAFDLFNFVKDRFDWYILTAYTTSGKEDCIAGKIHWVENILNIKPNENNFICIRSVEKQEYVGHKATNKQSILIDDRIRNIHQWQEKGGIGIHHTDIDITLNILREITGVR